MRVVLLGVCVLVGTLYLPRASVATKQPPGAGADGSNQKGVAVQFDGLSFVGIYAGGSLAARFFMEIWFQPRQISEILLYAERSGGYDYLLLSVNYKGLVEFRFSCGWRSQAVLMGSAAILGSWNYVRIEQTGLQGRLFVNTDAPVVARATFVVPFYSVDVDNNTIYIGGHMTDLSETRGVNLDNFTGQIQQVRTTYSTFTPTELTAGGVVGTLTSFDTTMPVPIAGSTGAFGDPSKTSTLIVSCGHQCLQNSDWTSVPQNYPSDTDSSNALHPGTSSSVYLQSPRFSYNQRNCVGFTYKVTASKPVYVALIEVYQYQAQVVWAVQIKNASSTFTRWQPVLQALNPETIQILIVLATDTSPSDTVLHLDELVLFWDESGVCPWAYNTDFGPLLHRADFSQYILKSALAVPMSTAAHALRLAEEPTTVIASSGRQSRCHLAMAVMWGSLLFH